jgi:sn-glycerol 3-phosphate transport system permease protein
LGVVAYALARIGIDWNYMLNSDHAMALIVMAAASTRLLGMD